MKKLLPIAVLPALLICLLFPAYNYASAISESQKEVITEYCGTIRQSLKTIQYLDTDNRIKLGAKYEIALSKFMTPMNLRLIKNNISVPELSDMQQAFADTKVNFSTDFTIYSKLLEELVATDCQNNPDEFYQKLVSTREARKNVRNDMLQLNNILAKYQETVKNLGAKHE